MAASPVNQSMMEGTWTSNFVSGENNPCCVPNRVVIFPWNDTYSNVSLQFAPNNSPCLSLYDQSDFVAGGVSWIQNKGIWLANIKDELTFVVTAQNKTSLSFNPLNPSASMCPFVMQRKTISLKETLDDMMGYWSEITVTYAESSRCCYPDYIRPFNNARKMTYKFSSNSSRCDPRIFKTGDMRFEPADQQANSIYEFDTGETVLEEVNVRLSHFYKESSLLLITHDILNFDTRNYERCSYYLSQKTATVPNITLPNPLNLDSNIMPNVADLTDSTATMVSAQTPDSHIGMIVLACLLICITLIVFVTVIILKRKAKGCDKGKTRLQNSADETTDYIQMVL